MEKVTLILNSQPCSCPNENACSKTLNYEYKLEKIFIENENEIWMMSFMNGPLDNMGMCKCSKIMSPI